MRLSARAPYNIIFATIRLYFVSTVRRWLAVSLGLWGKLTPALVVIGAALKLFGPDTWAAMPWESVVSYPALAAFVPLTLFGGWLTVMTDDWNR